MAIVTTNTDKEDKRAQPVTAWIFDVDGVLTDPEEKRITEPEIFSELIKRLEKGEPVGFNTGRSLDFVIAQVLDPLEAKLKDKNLLKNIFAIGEKGATWITFGVGGLKSINVDQNISVPKELQNRVREIVSKPPYSNTMFYDETKQTMISVELKLEKRVKDFKQAQNKLTQELQDVLCKYHLENNFKIDATRIATDIESIHSGKALGTKKFIELLEEKKIEPNMYICFGDSVSDYEMLEELNRLGKKSQFIFVGKKEDLSDKNHERVVFTKKLVDKGTLQYLKEN